MQSSEQAWTTTCGKAQRQTTTTAIAEIKRTQKIFHDHQQCRLPNELHYRYNLKNIYTALIYFAVILTQTNLVQSRSTSAKLSTFAKSTASGTTVLQQQQRHHHAASAATSVASDSIPFSSSFSSLLPSLVPKEKFSIETNSIQRYTISDLAGAEGGRSLKRVFISNRTITCNDGSQAGFYLRKNPNSKKWIVFLEGGWHCYDTRSCRARWLRLRHLMTSAQWPETRVVGGILSPLPEENPYWHNANHVLVPYCSSDSWSGTRATVDTTIEASDNNWRFMGALILRQVISDLIPLGLGRVPGAELLLVGSSAGGLGVMLNLDRITQFLLKERNLSVMVRGVSDSGWFIDREPYTPAAVASSESVRLGWKLWQGLLPEECTKKHTAEPWRCYFGYHLYPTLKAPLFVFQWLFDEAQMRADNVGAPVTPQQWNYIHEMGGALRSSLDNVTAVFAPSCIGHAVLSKREWVHIKIDDISLPAALRCWEHSTRPRRKRHQHDKLKRSTEATLNNDNDEISNNSNLDGTMLPRKQRHRKNKKNNNKKKNNNNNNAGKRRHNQQQKNNNNYKISNNDVEENQQNGIDQENINKQQQRSKQHLTKEQRAERQQRRKEARKKRREQRKRQRQEQREKNLHLHNSGNNSTDDFIINRKHNHRRQNKNNHNNNNNKKSTRMNNNKKNQRNLQLRERQQQQQQQNDDNTVLSPAIDSLFSQNDDVLRSTTTTAIVEKELLPYSQTGSSSSSTTALSSIETIYALETSKHNHYQQNTNNNNNNKNSNNNNKNNNSNNNKSKNLKLPRVPEKCSLRLLERCSWPQCNHSCPSLTNPLTGEEMRFLELLTSFGLDIEAVAAALGVDMQTLNNMDRTELVNLLTQQAS